MGRSRCSLGLSPPLSETFFQELFIDVQPLLLAMNPILSLPVSSRLKWGPKSGQLLTVFLQSSKHVGAAPVVALLITGVDEAWSQQPRNSSSPEGVKGVILMTNLLHAECLLSSRPNAQKYQPIWMLSHLPLEGSYFIGWYG